MDKILVEIYVPLLDRSFDMFIPVSLPAYEVLELIKKAVTDLSDGQFIANENTILCHREDGSLINVNLSVYELGIRNGSKLMLM